MTTAILIDLDNARPDLAELEVLAALQGQVEVRWAFHSSKEIGRLLGLQLSRYDYRLEVLPYHSGRQDALDRRIVLAARDLQGRVEQMALVTADRELVRQVDKVSQSVLLWLVQGQHPRPVGGMVPMSLTTGGRWRSEAQVGPDVPLDEWRDYVERGELARPDFEQLCKATRRAANHPEARRFLVDCLQEPSKYETRILRILAGLARLGKCGVEPRLLEWWVEQVTQGRHSSRLRFLLLNLPSLAGLWGGDKFLADWYARARGSEERQHLCRALLSSPQSRVELLAHTQLVLTWSICRRELLDACQAWEKLMGDLPRSGVAAAAQWLLPLLERQPDEIKYCLLDSLHARVQRVGCDQQGLTALAALPGDFQLVVDRASFVQALENWIAGSVEQYPYQPELAARRVARQIWAATEHLAGLRAYLDCSRGQLADWLGVHPATVRRWEYGQNKPSRSSQERLRSLMCQHTDVFRLAATK